MSENKQRRAVDLRPGEDAIVLRFSDNNIACKLMTLGVIPDCRISMIKKAPFGGAYCLKLGQTLIAVRTDEARSIIID